MCLQKKLTINVSKIRLSLYLCRWNTKSREHRSLIRKLQADRLPLKYYDFLSTKHANIKLQKGKKGR